MVEEKSRSNLVVPRPPTPKAEEDIIAQWEESVQSPELSIQCITYDHSKHIEDALNSFLMQKTSFPFEIIVYDDASTDGTQEIIEKYISRYPRLIRGILQTENQLSRGRKPLSFLVGKSKAEFVAFCDGDDYWTDPTKLQKQVDYLRKYPECVITGHDASIIGERRELLSPSKLPDIHKRDYSGSELMEGKAWILTMSWVYRNVISEFAPERNMVRNGDSFLISILGQYGSSHYHRDIMPAAYRVHEGGVWSSVGLEHKLDDQTNTWFWMYRYYKRIGMGHVANIFYSRVKNNIYRRSSFFELLGALIVHGSGWEFYKNKIKEKIGLSNFLRLKRMFRKR